MKPFRIHLRKKKKSIQFQTCVVQIGNDSDVQHTKCTSTSMVLGSANIFRWPHQRHLDALLAESKQISKLDKI